MPSLFGSGEVAAGEVTLKARFARGAGEVWKVTLPVRPGARVPKSLTVRLKKNGAVVVPAVAMTVLGFPSPSRTTSANWYTPPATSAMKAGVGSVADESCDWLPGGREIIAHSYEFALLHDPLAKPPVVTPMAASESCTRWPLKMFVVLLPAWLSVAVNMFAPERGLASGLVIDRPLGYAPHAMVVGQTLPLPPLSVTSNWTREVPGRRAGKAGGPPSRCARPP